jgi:hypothetical protein
MPTRSVAAPIEFAGPPARLSAVIALAEAAPRQRNIVVAEKEFPLHLSGDGKTFDGLWFSMPDETRPGKYQGEVVLDDARFPATVNIALRPLARIEPAAIEVKAPAGQTVKARLSVTNRGNGVLTLEADKAITLREAGALGQSLAISLKRKDLDLTDRLVSLGMELQQKPTHAVAVAGRMSPATLEIGARSKVTLELAIPEAMRAGTTWSGTLGLLGTRVRVSVEPVPTLT